MWALQVSFHAHKLTQLTFQPTIWVRVNCQSPGSHTGLNADAKVFLERGTGQGNASGKSFETTCILNNTKLLNGKKSEKGRCHK